MHAEVADFRRWTLIFLGSPDFNGNWAGTLGTLSGATGFSRRAVEEREKIGVFIASFDYAAQVRRSAQDASRQSRESPKSKEAKAKFDKMPYLHQKEYLGYVLEAKKAETRARRVEKMITELEKK